MPDKSQVIQVVTIQEFDIRPLFPRLKEFVPITNSKGVTKLHPPEYSEVSLYNNFLTGLVRTLGKKEGQYPVGYLDFINYMFGREKNTIEICSRFMQVDNVDTAATVDIDPFFTPTFCTSAETLAGVPSNFYKRARLDPPYGARQSLEIYGIERTPDFSAMLKQAARVCREGGLIFMLRGQEGGNQQFCKPYGLTRIGLVAITVVPNLEVRFLNIYAKTGDAEVQIKDLSNQKTLLL
jgi:hypothetical protein